jgi:hypothetical protein
MKNLLVLLPLLSSSLAIASSPDSASAPRVHTGPLVSYLQEAQYFSEDSLRYFPLDTLLKGVQNYNPAYYTGYGYRFLGNLGSAASPFQYAPLRRPGLHPGIRQLDLYGISSSSIRYYAARKRFTDIYYITGSNREQLLELTHSQNIRPNFNAGLHLRRMTTIGHLSDQVTYNSSLAGFVRYNTRNRRYNVLFNAIANKNENDENGGLLNDSILTEGTGITRNLPTGLSDAYTRWKSRQYTLSHFYNTGLDSTGARTGAIRLRIAHSLSYTKRSFVYQDDNPLLGFYPYVLANPLRTLDTTGVRGLENRVSLIAFSKRGSAQLFVKQENMEFLQGTKDSAGVTLVSADTLYSSHFAGASAEQKLGSSMRVLLKAMYGLAGYNAGDYLGEASLVYASDNLLMAGLTFATQRSAPDLVMNRYFSNHFEWFNSFSKMNVQSAGAYLALPLARLYAAVDYSLVEGYLYFGPDAKPAQHKGVINVISARLNKDFTLGNWHLDNRILFQFANPDRIRVPSVVSYQSLYYERRLAGKPLIWQAGIDVRYTGAYYSETYMPATGQFFLQNERLIGNYPVADVFFALKVKSARLFLKGEHVNDGLLQKEPYYLVPHYPMPGLTVKLGVSWRFYD